MCFQVPSDSKCSMIFHWPIFFFWLSTHPKNKWGDQEEEGYTPALEVVVVMRAAYPLYFLLKETTSCLFQHQAQELLYGELQHGPGEA